MTPAIQAREPRAHTPDVEKGEAARSTRRNFLQPKFDRFVHE